MKLSQDAIASPLYRFSLVAYCLVGLAFLFQGLRYVLAMEFMPYHAAVIETPWSELNASYQALFLGLLRGFGSGALCVGLAVLLLALIPFRSGAAWARWAIPCIALGYSSLLVFVTHTALPSGSTPIFVSLALCLLVALAATASLVGSRS